MHAPEGSNQADLPKNASAVPCPFPDCDSIVLLADLPKHIQEKHLRALQHIEEKFIESDMQPDYFSLQDHKKIQILVDLCVCFGMVPCFQEGVGVPLERRRIKLPGQLTSSRPATQEQSTLEQLSSFLTQAALRSSLFYRLVIPRFLSDLVAAHLQLLHHATECMPSSDTHAQACAHRHTQWLDALTQRVTPNDLVPSLTSLMALNPRCPTWMKGELGKLLSRALQRPGGVRATLLCLLAGRAENAAPAIERAQQLISTPPQNASISKYCARICPQVRALLISPSSKTPLLNQAAIQIASSLLASMPQHTSRLLFKPLFAPLLAFHCEARLMSLLHLLHVLETAPSEASQSALFLQTHTETQQRINSAQSQLRSLLPDTDTDTNTEMSSLSAMSVFREGEVSLCVECLQRMLCGGASTGQILHLVSPIIPALFRLACFTDRFPAGIKSACQEALMSYLRLTSNPTSLFLSLVLPPTRPQAHWTPSPTLTDAHTDTRKHVEPEPPDLYGTQAQQLLLDSHAVFELEDGLFFDDGCAERMGGDGTRGSSSECEENGPPSTGTHRRLGFGCGSAGGVEVRWTDEPRDYEQEATSALALLKKFPDAVSGVFLELLREFTALRSTVEHADAHAHAHAVGEDVMCVEEPESNLELTRRQQMILPLLIQLLEDVQPHTLQNLPQIVAFLSHILHTDNGEILRLALGILSAVVGSGQVTHQGARLIQSLLPRITELTSREEPEIREVAIFLQAAIATRDPGVFASTTAADDMESQDALETMKLASILEELRDPLLPVRAHALRSLQHMILNRSSVLQGKYETLFTLFQGQLRDDDSFLYGPAIVGLAALADVAPNDFIPRLVDSFTDASLFPVIRLKIGDAIAKSILRCGAVLPHYAHHYTSSLLTLSLHPSFTPTPTHANASTRARARTRRLVAVDLILLQASALSNLATLAGTLKGAVRPVLQRCVMVAMNLLETSTPYMIKQGALTLLASLLRGLRSDFALLEPDTLTKVFQCCQYWSEYRPLRYTTHTPARTHTLDECQGEGESDEPNEDENKILEDAFALDRPADIDVIQRHARIALGLIEEIVRELMRPSAAHTAAGQSELMRGLLFTSNMK